MKANNTTILIAVLLLTFVLSACGGGASGAGQIDYSNIQGTEIFQGAYCVDVGNGHYVRDESNVGLIQIFPDITSCQQQNGGGQFYLIQVNPITSITGSSFQGYLDTTSPRSSLNSLGYVWVQ